MKQNTVSKNVLERLPLYLQYLKSEGQNLGKTVSATTIARALNLGEVQVRKDLGLVSGAGRPKIGYFTEELVRQLEEYLSCRAEKGAVLVGAGKLGRALLDYDGFDEYGLRISAAFDCDKAKTGTTDGGKTVLPLSEFSEYCKKEKPKIGIITVPENAAEEICDMMVKNEILAIWNFSGRRLHVPENIIVRNENMASSLAVLSGYLKQQHS